MSKSSTDIEGLQLACRFALPPNSLGYCGRDSAPEKFKNCTIKGECEGVEKELTKFIVLHPYLKTLSEITDLPKYSYDVIEGYCIGNDLLNRAKPEHYQLLLKNFTEQGVPKWLVKELKKTPPKRFIPSHLFQVLHVGVGRASGSVPYNIETINNCMFRWGKVEKINKKAAKVTLNSLRELKDGYKLIQLKETHPFNKDLVPGLKIGETVAVHWNQVIKKLTKDEIKKLTFWTNEVLESL